MLVSEQVNNSLELEERDTGNGRGQLDTELASIVSSLSGFSGHNGTGTGSGVREQQIGGFRRASFASNTGSDADSEILFGGQTSPIMRRTALSVGGVPLGGGSHTQNSRVNGMGHYSASIAGGFTSQFQSNSGGISGAAVGSNGYGGGNGSGFFERFGRTLAEGTREVESNTGIDGSVSRRASVATAYDFSTTGSALHDGRRLSETSDTLESVSESLNMQNAEHNPTTIWNVAAAPVFRPQNFVGQSSLSQNYGTIHNRSNGNGVMSNNYTNVNEGQNSDSVESSNYFGNENSQIGYSSQPPFNYGYPTFNQFGMPVFLPPVFSSANQYVTQPFFGENNSNSKTEQEGSNSDENDETDHVSVQMDDIAKKNENGTINSKNISNNYDDTNSKNKNHINDNNDNIDKDKINYEDNTGKKSTITRNGISPYAFTPMYPLVYPLPKDNKKDEKNNGTQENGNQSNMVPPNMYIYMPPPHTTQPLIPGPNFRDLSTASQSPVYNFGYNKSNDDKTNDKIKGNSYSGNGKKNSHFSPSSSRASISNSMPQNSHFTTMGTKPPRQSKNSKPNNKQNIVRSPLLEEFRNNQTNKTYKLSDIYGSALEFCKDQHGSRFIQQELTTSSDAEKEIIFNEIRDEAISLSHDVFGNYVVQKFFEYGTSTQRNVLVDQFKGKMQDLSLEMYACRVIQKAFEFLDEDQKVELVSELSDSILPMIKDQNGNHVIQKAIECIPIQKLPFILNSLRGQIYHLSTHSYGCRVVQRILEFGTIQDQDEILNDLDQFIPFLIQDQYGNYVIQHILQHGQENENSHISKTKQNIIEVICENVVEYSKHKFASNVVEKSVIYSSETQIRQILNKILPENDHAAANLEDNAPLILMMRDQYANYVVQKLVNVATGKDQRLIVIAITSYLDRSNKNNVVGNRHLASVEKLASLVENIDICNDQTEVKREKK